MTEQQEQEQEYIDVSPDYSNPVWVDLTEAIATENGNHYFSSKRKELKKQLRGKTVNERIELLDSFFIEIRDTCDTWHKVCEQLKQKQTSGS